MMIMSKSYNPGLQGRCLESGGSIGSRALIDCTFMSEASSRDPFVFSTLRQPRCMKWIALVSLMVTL